EPELDLVRDRAGRRVGLERVAPEIAHHAAPRALAPGEEERGDVDHAAVAVGLGIDDDSRHRPRIHRMPRAAASEHEAIARRSPGRIDGGRAHAVTTTYTPYRSRK